MRHKKKINHLSRKRGHRNAMLSNMAASLIIHKRITTTTAKAKALKIYFEPLVTKAKSDTTHSRRQVFKYLQDKEATAELFREVAQKVADRPGGYTRIIKLGNRLGDNADMCIIELVDYNENLLAEKEASKKSSRRRRGGKKKSQEATTPEATAEKAAPAEDKAEDATDANATAEAAATDEVKEEEKTEEEAPKADASEEAAPEVETGQEEAPAAQKEEEKKEDKKAEQPAAEEAEEKSPSAEKKDETPSDDEASGDEQEKKE